MAIPCINLPEQTPINYSGEDLSIIAEKYAKNSSIEQNILA